MRRGCKRTPRTAAGEAEADDVAKLAERAARASGAAAVVLFGSGARGKLTPTSDLDLALVTREMPGDGSKMLRAARRALPPNRAVDLVTSTFTDLIVDDENDVTWARTMILDGIIVWENGRPLPLKGAECRAWAGRVDELRGETTARKRYGEDWDGNALHEWLAARRTAGRKQYAHSTHRAAAFARRAASAGITAKLTREGRARDVVETRGKLVGLAARAGLTQHAGAGAIRMLATMGPWRFKGEPEVSEDEALESLRTAWTVLKATVEIDERAKPPEELGPDEYGRPWRW